MQTCSQSEQISRDVAISVKGCLGTVCRPLPSTMVNQSRCTGHTVSSNILIVSAVGYSGGMSQEHSQERGVRQGNISKLPKATWTEEMPFVPTNTDRDPSLPVRVRSVHNDKIGCLPPYMREHHKILAMRRSLCETAD
jgi:hypothetical protein